MNRLRQREIIRTTLGDLIAAVTDEVTAAFGDTHRPHTSLCRTFSRSLNPPSLPAQRCSVACRCLKTLKPTTKKSSGYSVMTV